MGQVQPTVTALSKEVIQLCFHTVAHPDDDEPYSCLKDDLLQHHTLTNYQRIERLFAVGPLGSRHLAEIMELYPDNEEASCFLVFLFKQILPAWFRVQMTRTISGSWRRATFQKQSESVTVLENQEYPDVFWELCNKDIQLYHCASIKVKP